MALSIKTRIIRDNGTNTHIGYSFDGYDGIGNPKEDLLVELWSGKECLATNEHDGILDSHGGFTIESSSLKSNEKLVIVASFQDERALDNVNLNNIIRDGKNRGR